MLLCRTIVKTTVVFSLPVLSLIRFGACEVQTKAKKQEDVHASVVVNLVKTLELVGTYGSTTEISILVSVVDSDVRRKTLHKKIEFQESFCVMFCYCLLKNKLS